MDINKRPYLVEVKTKATSFQYMYYIVVYALHKARGHFSKPIYQALLADQTCSRLSASDCFTNTW